MAYIDVPLDSIDDVDLIFELESRGYNIADDINLTLTELYNLKRTNDPRFDTVFAEYVWNKLGRIL